MSYDPDERVVCFDCIRVFPKSQTYHPRAIGDPQIPKVRRCEECHEQIVRRRVRETAYATEKYETRIISKW